MPIKYVENYPLEWSALAREIKEANGYICQACGQQCTRPGQPYDRRRVLTVAHLDHDYDGARIFVAPLCVLCHFEHDRGLGHLFRRRNDHWRRARAGQLDLIVEALDVSELADGWPSLEPLPDGVDIFAGIYPVVGVPL